MDIFMAWMLLSSGMTGMQDDRKSEAKMDCPRCHGLMYLERLCDIGDVSYGWKCINCGALIDRIIMINHARVHKASLPVRVRSAPVCT